MFIFLKIPSVEKEARDQTHLSTEGFPAIAYESLASSRVHLFVNLREFAGELTSSWPPARVEGRVWAALLGQDPANPANLADPANPANRASVPECAFWSNPPPHGLLIL